jgi:hypothetical protein
LEGDTDEDGELDVDETWMFTASRTVTQEEMDSGANIENTATASADQSAESMASAAVGVLQIPEVSIDKQPDVVSVDAVGQVITYTIAVANPGNVSLTEEMMD